MKRRFLAMLALFFIMPAVGLYDNSQDLEMFEARAKNTNRVVTVLASARDVKSRLGRDGYFEKRGPSRKDVYFANGKARKPVDMLEEERIIVFPEDHVEFFPDPKFGLGSQITVSRAAQVVLVDNGQSVTYRTWGNRVKDLLREKEIEITDFDKVMPGLEKKIEDGMTIEIARAEDGLQVEHYYLPLNVVVKDDPWLPSGRVVIKQPGERGERKITWRVVKIDGDELKRELVEDKMIGGKDRIVLNGIKPVTFQGPYRDWINEAAAKYRVDAGQMYRVMMCESAGNPYAMSTHGKYKGLFQYDNRTWSVSGWGDHDIFDPYAQINAAAKAWDSRYTKWPVTSRLCGDLGK